MPKPIPEWDQLRVLVSYLLRRQLSHKPTTLKQASQRMGLAVAKIYNLLEDNTIIYWLRRTTYKYKYEGMEIFIRSIPEEYEPIFKVENKDIYESFLFFEKQEITLKKEPDTVQLRKEKRRKEKIRKMRYFLAEEKETM